MPSKWGVMLKHIAIVRFIACACLVASAAVATGEEAFVGSWRLDGGSMAVPENCARMTARFVDGQYEGDDGYMVLRLRYVVESHKGKFLLRFSYLSDNDVSNCQGLSPEHVRRNILRSALIEVLDPNRLKLHYGETEQGPYLIFVRDK